ncbi:hypothetical protein D1007_43136 [Hordeum vulgare]|nr:hypothetical protein D1007_43136 [Hordeum vulgare]
MAGGSSSKRPSVQKAYSQGAWLGSDVGEGHIEALRHHRLLPPASQALVRLPGAETAPTPAVGEVVVFVEHLYRGFGLPASSSFAEWLQFFGLKPHHLAPNAILQLAAFVVLCEGFVGIEPCVDLWRNLFFFKKQSIAMEKSEKGLFYVKNADPAVDVLNMPSFDIAPPTRLNWDAKTPKPIFEVALICAHLNILEKGGLLGRDLLTTMVACRIPPLQRRPHLVCQMSGRHDPCRLSTKRFTPGAVARRVNLISTARMDESGEWTWGMSPFNRTRLPPMLYEKLHGSLRPPAPDVDVSDASEIEGKGMIESCSDSSAGSQNPLESEGTEPSSEYARPSVAD